ncbi:hypothetical protein HY622_00205 [Candidatus Uhrbacteria bacterium]|nr:hypothetical protein [Candidatus Uhrbacteria bacterium]
MPREKAGSKAFVEGVSEAASDRKEYKVGSMSFDEVRKVMPKLADEFRTDTEAIRGAPEQSKRGITDALTKDLRPKVAQAKGVVDAWLIIKEAEVRGLLAGRSFDKEYTSLEQLYSRSAENPKLGSLRDVDVKKVIPNLEALFRVIRSDIAKNLPTMSGEAAEKYLYEKVSVLANELEQAKAVVTAWFSMLPHETYSDAESVSSGRASGSTITDQQTTSVYAKAAELLREQPPSRGTAPLETRGTAPLVEGEFDIDSSKVTLQNLMSTLINTVIRGPATGRGFLQNIEESYGLFQKTVKLYYSLRDAMSLRYRGEQFHDAQREMDSYGNELRHLVGGIKSLMVLSESRKSEIGKANVPIIEDRIKAIKDDLDQVWADIGYSVGTQPSVFRGSRQFLTNPKKGK